MNEHSQVYTTKESWTEKQVTDYLIELGFDVYHDNSEEVNLSIVYENAINEGFKYNESTNMWER